MPENPRTVLLVDDDPDIRDALGSVLRDEGYVVFLAGDGQEALEMLLTGQRPDAVILDLMMPRLNGFDFLNRLRQLGALAEVPVIVHSANRGYEADDLGVFDIVRKPAAIEHLLEALDRAAA